MLTAICILMKIKNYTGGETFLIQKNVNSKKLKEHINNFLKNRYL